MPDSLHDRQDAFSKRLQQMVGKHSARTEAELKGMGWDPASLPPPTLRGSPVEQMTTYNNWLDERIRIWRNEAPVEQPKQPREQAPSLEQRSPAGFGGVRVFSAVDALLFEDFELKRFPLPSQAFMSLPVFYQEREQFVRAVGQGLGLSAAEVSALLANSPLNEMKAVFIPGAGCLVDASGFPGLRIDTPQKEVTGDFEARLDLMRCIMQSRWGWGFLLEYTTQGHAMQQNGLYAAWVCRELGCVPDSLKSPLARLDVLEHSQMLAVQGWQEWIWRYLYQKHYITGPDERSQAKEWSNNARLTAELVRRLARFIKFDWGSLVLQMYDVVDLLNFIAFQFLHLPERADEWMRNLEDALAETNDAQLSRAAGVLRVFLAQKYFKALEAHLGSYCLPYVMMIAFHVPDEQYPVDLAMLRAVLRENAQVNANKRLLMLTQLDTNISYDPHALRIAVRDKCHLVTPDAYFRQAGF